MEFFFETDLLVTVGRPASVRTRRRVAPGDVRAARSSVDSGAPGSLVGTVVVLQREGAPMRAQDLATPVPMVDRHTSAADAARQIADGQLPGLVVADDRGIPVTVISAVDVLRLLVPDYILEDMALAGVFDERGAEDVWSEGSRRVIGDLLDDQETRMSDILRVDADATLVEVAAEMVDARAQIAVLHGSAESEPRFVVLPAVMEAVLRFGGASEQRGDSRR
jgi:CBS domain-containing protein